MTILSSTTMGPISCKCRTTGGDGTREILAVFLLSVKTKWNAADRPPHADDGKICFKNDDILM